MRLSSITNGIETPSWVVLRYAEPYDRYLGPERPGEDDVAVRRR